MTNKNNKSNLEIDINYKSLYDLMNEILPKYDLHFKKLDEFITDDKKAKEFILSFLDSANCILLYNSDTKESNNEIQYSISETRARHQAITYLMGLVFWNLSGFCHSNKKLSVDDLAMWQMISLHHDIGYFSNYILQEDFDISTLEYRLLIENYETISQLNGFDKNNNDYFAYSYEEIERYFNYSKKYRLENKSEEKNDHGIVGAALIFDSRLKDLIKQGKQTITELDTEKAIFIKKYCMIIAQHNIFKSPNKKIDEVYKCHKLENLCSTAPIAVNKKRPWLLFLSFIDTFECVKRFSRKLNQGSYLETLTVLKNINILIKDSEIIFDFTSLKNELIQKNLIEV